MIALLVMTDGRDHIEDTITSAALNLVGPISERWIHDDSGDPAVAARLRERHWPFWRIVSTPGRSGFGGAIRSAWSHLRAESEAPYVFHLEDDFLFNRPIDLTDLVGILERNPDLVNLALRRQPWNDHERAAGGIVEQHPDAYTERHDGIARAPWLEHRLFFTTNPGLYRRRLILEHDWPEGTQSEGRFSHYLLGDERARFGYYGARYSGEAVEHVGHTRNGIGY